MKKKKKDNNLVCVLIGNTPHYFTSATRAGKYVGLASCSVVWAMTHNNDLTTEKGESIKFSIVDGSDIPYKYINNED